MENKDLPFDWKLSLKCAMNILIFLVAVCLCLVFVSQTVSFFVMISISGVIVGMANPIAKLLENRVKIRRKAGSAVAILALISLILLLFYTAVLSLLKEAAAFVASLPAIYEGSFRTVGNVFSSLQAYLPEWLSNTNMEIAEALESFIYSLVSELRMPLLEIVGSLAMSLPDLLVNITLCILLSYYWIADADYLPNRLGKILPYPVKEKIGILKTVFVDAMGGYLKSQVKIEAWIFLLLLIGFFFLQIESPLLIALIVAIADFMPVLGTGFILIPWAIIELLSKNYLVAIGVFGIWLSTFVARQMIQPNIVGNSVGLGPIPTVLLIATGYYAAGFTGMIFSVPIGIILMNLYKNGMFESTITSAVILYREIERFRDLSSSDIDCAKKAKEEMFGG